MPLPFAVLLGVWAVWWVSWLLAAAWSQPSQTQLPRAEEMRHRVLTVAGVVLLFVPLRLLGPFAAATTLYMPTAALVWTCVVVTLVGFAFAWWARISLGTLWSANVARKAIHAVVDEGPYGLVRHPIYTGIILAAIAAAVAKGTILGAAGAALLALSFYVKAQMEERFLEEELGPGAYAAYRARVPMLVPFWPVR